MDSMFRSRNWRPEITGQTDYRRVTCSAAVRRLRGNIVNFRIDESLPEATGAFIDWLVNESGWTIEEERQRGRYCPAPHLHSVSPLQELFRPTSLGLTFAPWKRDGFRMFLSAVAPFMIGRKSSRCAMPLPRLNGRMTSCGSMRLSVGRYSRSVMMPCLSTGKLSALRVNCRYADSIRCIRSIERSSSRPPRSRRCPCSLGSPPCGTQSSPNRPNDT